MFTKTNNMKQIFLNGTATRLFFSDKVSFDDVFEWIQEQVMFSDKNIFNLNEQRSCSVNNHIDGICISGDEDLKIISIETVKTIL